jgi:hypothetical protein
MNMVDVSWNLSFTSLCELKYDVIKLKNQSKTFKLIAGCMGISQDCMFCCIDLHAILWSVQKNILENHIDWLFRIIRNYNLLGLSVALLFRKFRITCRIAT